MRSRGGSTGPRTCTLVEPSRTFCDWAARLLLSEDDLPEIPVVDVPGAPVWQAARSRPAPLAPGRVRIACETLEAHRPDGRYDLITCLNVVDRHPDPRSVVEAMESLIGAGGLLVLSCPFDFQDDITPKAARVDDLHDLFAGRGGWTPVGNGTLFYEFRAHRRNWTRLSSQIIGMTWRP